MRICLVDNASPNSRADGAAIYVSQLGPALASEHRVSILTVRSGLAHFPHAIGALRRMLTSDRPEIVHMNNLSGLTLAVVLWAVDDSIPLALSLHDYRLLDHWSRFNRSLVGRFRLVISPSNYALDQHLRHGFFGAATTIVIPYGIDAPSPLEREGSGGGFFIFRSTWNDPFPVAIQEAFRSGQVVIAERVGGVPEMVRDGVNGLLVEPGDEDGIAAAVNRLQSSPELATRLRASGLETARLYDMRFQVARLTDAYRQLLTAQRIGDLDNRAA